MARKQRRMVSRVEHWPIDRLKPFERNPRTHSAEQVKKIAASIATYGFNTAITVADDGTILAGHGRVLAARELGLTDVPVAVVDLTAAEQKGYVIADNKTAADARWNEALLGDLLREMQEEGADLMATGFDDADLARLMDDLDEQAMGALMGDDPAPQIPAAHPTLQREQVSSPAPASAPAAPPDMSLVAPDYVPLSVVMTPDQRAACYEAIRKAKADHGTDNSGEALFIIARRYIDG